MRRHFFYAFAVFLALFVAAPTLITFFLFYSLGWYAFLPLAGLLSVGFALARAQRRRELHPQQRGKPPVSWHDEWRP